MTYVTAMPNMTQNVSIALNICTKDTVIKKKFQLS